MTLQLRAALLLSLALPVTGQAWSKRYLDPLPRSLAVEPNGDLVVLRRDSVLVLQPDGTVVTRIGSPNARLAGICRTSDGGHAVCGTRNIDFSPYCARFDSSWNLLWDWNIDYFDYWGGSMRSVFELPGGDLRVVGHAYYSGSSVPGGSPLHLRVDSSGGVVQDMRSTCNCIVSDAAMRPDGSYFSLNTHVSYYYTVPGEGDTVLELWDAGGNLIAHTWPAPGQSSADRVNVTPDGGCLVITRRFLRFDSAGDLVLQRDYQAGQQTVWGTSFSSAVPTPDGGAILAGAVLVDDRWHGRLLKLDSAYDVEWDRAYGDDQGLKGFVQAIPYAGGYVVLGTDLSALEQTWVLRTDALGLVPSCQSIPLSTNTLQFGDDQVALGLGEWPNPRPAIAVGAQFPPSSSDGTDFCFSATMGARYCTPALPNSSGLPAELHVGGSLVAADHSVALVGVDLPSDQFGYFLIGAGNNTVVPPGAQGNLCLAGAFIHRYVTQIQSSGAAGVMAIYPDVSGIPGHGSVLPGETWNFQAWFRDMNPGSTSNFTDAVGVTFQ